VQIDDASWNQVSALFDELAELEESERERRLSGVTLAASSRRLLHQLLSAHDTSDTHFLDQTLNRIAVDLAGKAPDEGGEIPALLSGERLGNWRVGEPIAHGAMAMVFHGERADDAYEQHVAIKVLQPGRYRRAEGAQLREELRLLALLEHPGIARLIDGGVSDQGWPYLVMEYVDGLPIDRWCLERRLDLGQRIRLVRKVCDAVRYAHGKLVVHADIKPSNVLVNAAGEVKLVDFGIAGLLRDDASEADQKVALLRCSPAYAAPEQLQGGAASTAHDVFGVGALLYELLTGKRIRDGKAATELLLGREAPDGIVPPSRCDAAIFPDGDLQGDLDAICMKALATNPEDRYRAIELLRQDLDNHLHHHPVGARLQTRAYTLSRWLYRHRAGASLAAVLLLTLVVGLTVSIRQTLLAKENARKAEAVTQFLLTVFDADEPGNYEAALQTPRRDLAVRAAEDLDRILPRQSTARTELKLSIGRVLRKVGLTDQARPLVEQVVAELENGAGRVPDGLRIAAWFELGQIESLEERMAPAAEAFRRADEIARGLPDPPVARAAILFQLGRVLRPLGALDEGLAVLDEAARLAYGDEATRTLLPRIQLLNALILNNADRFDDALLVGEQAVADARTVLGSDHDRTASALSTVGGMYRRAGRLERAESMLREAVAIGRRNYGQPNPAPVNNLALVLSNRGDFVAAETFQQEALDLAESYYGPESAAAARYRRNLGLIQAAREDWSNALANLRRAADVHTRNTSATHDTSILIRGQWAWVLLQAGDPESVGAILPELLVREPLLRETFPRGALWVHMVAAELGIRRGSIDQGMRHAAAIDSILTGTDGGVNLDNWEQVQLRYIRGLAHSATGDAAAARAQWLEGRELAARLLGPEHPLRADIERRIENNPG
jgi:serine/threonine-protein kinase